MSVAGFAAIGGAVAVGTAATASPSTPTAPTTSTAPSDTSPSQTSPAVIDDGGPSWRRDDRGSGPVAGSSGSLSPDTSSHGS